MATRATIVLKIRDNDIGKSIKIDPSIITNEKDKINTYNKKCNPISLDAPYIEIYSHWDGYPDGLGKELYCNFRDYDKVLNLILGGDVSFINNNEVGHYCIMNDDESFEENKPKVYKDCPPVEEDYEYLFENGIWYVRGSYKYNDFIPIEDVFASEVFEEK